jgi:vacuolar-type H+-ATPase subunit E/Vma4
MTALKDDRVIPALEPVRAELLQRATADAQRMISDAQSEASRIIEEASCVAQQVTEKARLAGEAAGKQIAAGQAASLRQALRRELLTAQDEAYRQWRHSSLEAALRLRDDPKFTHWQDALHRAAYAVLGEEAKVVDDLHGGIIAESGRRRLDLSLSAIAERVLDQIAPEVNGLWT